MSKNVVLPINITLKTVMIGKITFLETSYIF